MYKQLMDPPYCMLASDIDHMTFSQFLLYFSSEDSVKGSRQLSKSEIKEVLKDNSTEKISREEFLRRNEEIRKQKKKLFEERRRKRIEAAKGMGRTK